MGERTVSRDVYNRLKEWVVHTFPRTIFEQCHHLDLYLCQMEEMLRAIFLIEAVRSTCVLAWITLLSTCVLGAMSCW